jgi:hypothetical protein
VLVEDEVLSRQLSRGLSGVVSDPLDEGQRIEVGAGLKHYDCERVTWTTVLSLSTGERLSETQERVTQPGITLGQTSVAFVRDRAFFGLAIGQFSLVRPFDRPSRGRDWQFSLTPGFSLRLGVLPSAAHHCGVRFRASAFVSFDRADRRGCGTAHVGTPSRGSTQPWSTAHTASTTTTLSQSIPSPLRKSDGYAPSTPYESATPSWDSQRVRRPAWLVAWASSRRVPPSHLIG